MTQRERGAKIAGRRDFLKLLGSSGLFFAVASCKNSIPGVEGVASNTPGPARVCPPTTLAFRQVHPAVSSSLRANTSGETSLGFAGETGPFEKTFRFGAPTDIFHLSLSVSFPDNEAGDATHDTALEAVKLSIRLGNGPWQNIPVMSKSVAADGNTFVDGRFQALLISEHGKGAELTFRLEGLPPGLRDAVIDADVSAENEEPMPLSLTSQQPNPFIPPGFSSAPVGLSIIPRSQWNALAPKKAANKASWKKVVVHHSGLYVEPSADPGSVVRSYQRHHMNAEKFDDIGYNFLVALDGRVFEGRNGGRDAEGAHAKGANSESVGICFMGQFHDPASGKKNEPTPVQLESGARLIAWLAKECGIDLAGSSSFSTGSRASLPNVTMHRDVGATMGAENATACPGSRMYGKVDTLKTTAISYLAQLQNPQSMPADTRPGAC